MLPGHETGGKGKQSGPWKKQTWQRLGDAGSTEPVGTATRRVPGAASTVARPQPRTPETQAADCVGPGTAAGR